MDQQEEGPTGYLIIDTETSGLYPKDPETKQYVAADDARAPYLASFCAIFTDPDLSMVANYHIPIRPDGWEMTPEATAINGLTTERLREIGKPVSDALNIYEQAIIHGYVIVAHNAWFDLKVMRGAMRRSQRHDLYGMTRYICTMRARGGRWKDLRTSCEELGISLSDAHTSMGDAFACLEIARNLKARSLLPKPRGGQAQEVE